MAKAYVLYNPLAGGGHPEAAVDKLRELISDELVLHDMTIDQAYENDLSKLDPDDYLIVCGGDGTLNCFVNKIAGMSIENDILYFPCGSGNDFAREVGKAKFAEPFSIKKYIKDLPTVTVNGKTTLFINGVGYGIDGYCCEEGDRLRSLSKEPINYTNIAIKGLLFHYKPANAKVTVDGVTTEYKRVWIAPTMNGKYYGGGIMPTPAQDRLSDSGKLSVMIFHDTNNIQTLMIFPSLFKGEHVSKKKHVTIIEGYDISVEFDAPRTVQVDGETYSGVTGYRAVSAKKEK